MATDAITVLIVDDEKRLRDQTAKLLKKDGVLADTAESGEQALSILKTQRYDVILLDVKMPGMSGIEMLRVMRRENVTAEVIVHSGYASVDDAAELMRLGASDYLIKPYRYEDLLEKIIGACERSRVCRVPE